MTKWYLMFMPFLLTSIILMILVSIPHPVHVIIMALIYSMMMSMSMSIWKINYIAPIMFSLIMISGLMIIFLYFSSLVSNAKHKMKKPLILTLATVNLTIILIIPSSYCPFTQTPDHTHLNLMNFTIDPMTFMYFPPLQSLTMISMIYLLITMMAIIKTCSPRAKSMRTKSLK